MQCFLHPRDTGNDEATSFFSLFHLSALGKQCFLCVSVLFPCLQALREHLQPCSVRFYFTPICIPLGCGNRKPRVCVLCECHVEASVLVDMSFCCCFYKHSAVWIWCCFETFGGFQARVQMWSGMILQFSLVNNFWSHTDTWQHFSSFRYQVSA